MTTNTAEQTKKRVQERDYKQSRSTYLQDRIQQLQEQLKETGLETNKRLALQKSLKSMKDNLSKIKSQSSVINPIKGTSNMSNVKKRAIEQATASLEELAAPLRTGGGMSKGTQSKKNTSYNRGADSHEDEDEDVTRSGMRRPGSAGKPKKRGGARGSMTSDQEDNDESYEDEVSRRNDELYDERKAQERMERKLGGGGAKSTNRKGPTKRTAPKAASQKSMSKSKPADDAEIQDKAPRKTATKKTDSAPAAKKPTKAQRSTAMNELLKSRETLRGQLRAHKKAGDDTKAQRVLKKINAINSDLKENYSDINPDAHKASSKADHTKDANGKRYTKRGVTKMINELKDANERGRKTSAAYKKREEDIKRLSKILKTLTTTASVSASDTLFLDKVVTAGIETDISDIAQATGLILGIQYRDFQDRNEFYQIVPEAGESRRVELQEVEDVVDTLDEYGIKDAIIVDKKSPRASVSFDATLNNKTYRVVLESSKGTLRIAGQYD